LRQTVLTFCEIRAEAQVQVYDINVTADYVRYLYKICLVVFGWIIKTLLIRNTQRDEATQDECFNTIYLTKC